MSIIRRVLGTEEKRNLTGLGLIPTSFDRVPNYTISRVDETTTMGLSTAWACVTLLADLTSTFPIDAYYRDNGVRLPYRPDGAKPSWMTTPQPGEPTVGINQVIAQLVAAMYLNGNGYLYTPRDQDGEVLEIRALDPRHVTIRRDGRTVRYVVRSMAQTEGTEYGPDEILHIPLIRPPGRDYGINPIEALRNTIGLGLTLEDYAGRFFATGSTPTGIIETPDPLTPDQARSLKEGWLRHHTGDNVHTPGVLSGGATFKPLSFRPEDAQLLSSREFTVNEIARIFRVPPALLAVTTPGAMSYASVEQLSDDFVRFTLRPLTEKIERALSTLLPRPEAFVRFTMDSLLRGSTQARAEAYRTGLSAGYLTVAEVRRLEDLSPIDEENVNSLRQPLNEADAALASTRQRAEVYSLLISSGVDAAEAKRISGL